MSTFWELNVRIPDGFFCLCSLPVRARESSVSDNNENGAVPRTLPVSTRTRGLTTRAKAGAPAATRDDNGAASEEDDNAIEAGGGRTAPTRTRRQVSLAERQKARTHVSPDGADSDDGDDGVHGTSTSRPATPAAARMDAPAKAGRAKLTTSSTAVRGHK